MAGKSRNWADEEPGMEKDAEKGNEEGATKDEGGRGTIRFEAEEKETVAAEEEIEDTAGLESPMLVEEAEDEEESKEANEADDKGASAP